MTQGSARRLPFQPGAGRRGSADRRVFWDGTRLSHDGILLDAAAGAGFYYIAGRGGRDVTGNAQSGVAVSRIAGDGRNWSRTRVFMKFWLLLWTIVS